jgi:hypothetical protein
LVYFTSFNINKFYGSNIEHNNIGDSIAISAQDFIKKNNLPSPTYVSGAWNYSFYLAVFMHTKPSFIRKWQTSNKKGSMILIFDGCNLNMNMKQYGYNLVKNECKSVKLIDKHKPQTAEFTYYYVTKQ